MARRSAVLAACRWWPAALAAVWLTGCAGLPAGKAGQPGAAEPPDAAASGAADARNPVKNPAKGPAPGEPKPFAAVIQGAQRSDGFIPVWRKDDKVWLEIAPDRLNRLMLMTASVTNSVGERGLYAGQMASDAAIELRIVGKAFQVVAKNLAYRSDADAAMQRAVRQSFSDSLLTAGPVASAPHPDSKAVLVDASLLMNDIIGYGTGLERAFRLPFGLDRNNSYFDAVNGTGRSLSLTVQMHFATPRIPAPPLKPPPDVPNVPPPSATPDPRSFYVGVIYNFAALPGVPMTPRAADPRVGYFTESYVDLGSDLAANPRVHHVQRWRLEKKDPAAALSEPVRPITYWLDRNIPLRYRGAVTAGILEWNKAFEKIGFRDAIVVRQQPDDADWDTLDTEHASVRWFTGADVGLVAIGPRVADPRSGEILDADIAMSDVLARGARRFLVEDVGALALDPQDERAAGDHKDRCDYAMQAAQELDFALDLLEARGDIAPDSPEAEAFVLAQIKASITHEVGHTLGLRHNFRASTVITRAQLEDPAYSATQPIVGSVMDYDPPNIPLAGEPKAGLSMTTLGPYDYWAIEYAYRPIPRQQEAEVLSQIAARSTEPLLAFGDDADAGASLDPRDNAFDLGDDPLAYAKRRVALSRELWARAQARGPQVGDDPQRLRRSVLQGFGQMRLAPILAAKYVGGMYTERDLPGTTARPTYRPVEPARQREALQFLTAGLFGVDSLKFNPEFLADVGPDFIEWRRGAPLSVPAAALALQSRALNMLLDPGTARRLLDLPYYLPERERAGAISLNEVYATLQGAVWSELQTGAEIDPLRRNLQREHMKRLQAILTGKVGGLPADALSLARLQAGELQAALKKAALRRGLSVETRAHLQDSLGTLTEALRATMQRS
ncbi:MAG: zinc-dependent metalloprotease [Rubrivivax sp.]|nr:zinc-dependent metalloprotease [Rubrivivax sp.]